MQFSFLHPFKLNLRSEHTQASQVIIHRPIHDESEGSEFLDDAVRHEETEIQSPDKKLAPGLSGNNK